MDRIAPKTARKFPLPHPRELRWKLPESVWKLLETPPGILETNWKLLETDLSEMETFAPCFDPLLFPQSFQGFQSAPK